jgi:hypothetical protein
MGWREALTTIEAGRRLLGRDPKRAGTEVEVWMDRNMFGEKSYCFQAYDVHGIRQPNGSRHTVPRSSGMLAAKIRKYAWVRTSIATWEVVDGNG